MPFRIDRPQADSAPATATDVSEQRLAGIGLRLAGVFHDFRGLMHVISSCAELMAHIDDRQERMKYAAEIARRFQLVDSMTEDVMAYVRGESNLLVRRVFLNEYLPDLVAELQRNFVGREIAILLDSGYDGDGYFDEHKMTRVAVNLANNAAKAMSYRGQITVRSRVDDDWLYLEVDDTGPGIPESLQRTLFHAFASGSAEGTGLGLAIVKSIVDEHGGTISFLSSTQGSCFTIRLARKQPTWASGTRKLQNVE